MTRSFFIALFNYCLTYLLFLKMELTYDIYDIDIDYSMKSFKLFLLNLADQFLLCYLLLPLKSLASCRHRCFGLVAWMTQMPSLNFRNLQHPGSSFFLILLFGNSLHLHHYFLHRQAKISKQYYLIQTIVSNFISYNKAKAIVKDRFPLLTRFINSFETFCLILFDVLASSHCSKIDSLMIAFWSSNNWTQSLWFLKIAWNLMKNKNV